MSDWKRQTKEVSLDGMSPKMAEAIHLHIDKYNLGPVLSDALICVETDSEQAKKGLFGSARVVKVAAVLTPRWLVWAIGEPKRKPAVLSAQLIEITVQDYEQTSFAMMVPDSGIEVRGMFTDASESASAFIGLEAGQVGDRFKETVIKATQDAKK